MIDTDKIKALITCEIENGTKKPKLAKLIGIPYSSLHNYMDGMEPRYESLVKIARYFGLPVADFLEDSKPTTPSRCWKDTTTRKICEICSELDVKWKRKVLEYARDQERLSRDREQTT